MYEKSFWLVDFFYELVFYQHNKPFKIIGVFNIIITRFAFIDLLQKEDNGTRNNAIHSLIIFVNTQKHRILAF